MSIQPGGPRLSQEPRARAKREARPPSPHLSYSRRISSLSREITVIVRGGNCRARSRTILNHPLLLGVWNRLPPEEGRAPDTDGYDISEVRGDLRFSPPFIPILYLSGLSLSRFLFPARTLYPPSLTLYSASSQAPRGAQSSVFFVVSLLSPLSPPPPPFPLSPPLLPCLLLLDVSTSRFPRSFYFAPSFPPRTAYID